jgi:acid stress chaperone HdeB
MKPAWLGLSAVILIAASPAGAQVTIDVSKITCEQFWLRKVANPDKVAIWLGGYFNGRKGNTVIDTQQFEAIARDVTEHCRAHFQLTVMQAAEAVMADKK